MSSEVSSSYSVSPDAGVSSVGYILISLGSMFSSLYEVLYEAVWLRISCFTSTVAAEGPSSLAQHRESPGHTNQQHTVLLQLGLIINKAFKTTN